MEVPYEISSYSFTNDELDLAIISLNISSKKTIELLLENGFEPITLDDIGEEPSEEGVEVYAIGFPGAVSRLGSTELTIEQELFYSNQFTLPVTSFGRVAMLISKLPFFWTDISIYQGNSGGPIIENGKLVGIVSSNALILTEGAKDKTRIPFGKMIKSGFLKPLLEEQIRKDLIRKELELEILKEKDIIYDDDLVAFFEKKFKSGDR